MMEKSGCKAIREFTSTSYNQFGMRIIILRAFIDDEGDPAMTL
jgi:hypothetical protein